MNTVTFGLAFGVAGMGSSFREAANQSLHATIATHLSICAAQYRAVSGALIQLLDGTLSRMAFRLGSFFQKNAHSTSRRLYFAVLRRFSGVFAKRQSVYFVDINGTRFKRVVMGDSYEASLAEKALKRLPTQAHFPRLIQRHENELLLTFVEGRKFDSSSAGDRAALAAFSARST